MTLILNPSTSLRPLGEEHLRMFRRAFGPAQEKIMPRTVVPKEAQIKKFGVSLTAELSSYDEARALRGRKLWLATITDLVMDKRLLKKIKVPGAFIDWRDVPRPGYYLINRPEKRLEPVSEKEFWAFGRDRSVQISERALQAIEEKRPLGIISPDFEAYYPREWLTVDDPTANDDLDFAYLALRK